MTKEEAIKVYQGITNLTIKEAFEFFVPELKESEDEKIRKTLIDLIKCNERSGYSSFNNVNTSSMLAWLEKQGEQKLDRIQWTGDNLKDVIEFTGYSSKFDKWFVNWKEYETYVHSHNNIFKMFNEDGSHYEVPVGAWIVKTPDGHNVASKATYVQKHDDSVSQKHKNYSATKSKEYWSEYFKNIPRKTRKVKNLITGVTYNSVKEAREKENITIAIMSRKLKEGKEYVYVD